MQKRAKDQILATLSNLAGLIWLILHILISRNDAQLLWEMPMLGRVINYA